MILTKRITGYLVVLSLLLQLTLPFFALYSVPQSAQAAEQIRGLFGDKILICTQEGFRWISPETLAEHPPAPHEKTQCALCYVHVKDVDDIPASCTAAIALHLPDPQTQSTIWPETPLATKSETFSPSAPPRAPPFIG